MAALGKIRSKSVMLIGIIGFALFAFIAEELFRSCESSRNEQNQRVGEVLGEKINYQEFQAQVDEFANVIKLLNQTDNLTDEQLNQVKDQVWNTIVQHKIIDNEAEKLGLTVTDKEMETVLREGTHQMLQQTPFNNQQTGRFDINILLQFLNEYKKPEFAAQYKSMYDYWKYIETTIRYQILSDKYRILISACMLSNPVTQKAMFDAENIESDIQLAAFPYSAINDNTIKITDADMQAKYEELKEQFYSREEMRDIEYVDVKVQPSAADMNVINKEFATYREQLLTSSDVSNVVRKSASSVSYNGLLKTKNAFPEDIAKLLDSISVGTTTAVTENKSDNTLNIVRLLSKVQLPDSVEYRAIQVAEADEKKAAAKADSIMQALNAGGDFEVIAKNYKQDGKKQWAVSSQYQNGIVDQETRDYLMSLQTMGVKELKKFKIGQVNIIVQVTDRKAMVDKYDVAVIKKDISFSKDTYSAAYNKFSEFVSKNQDLASMKKNAAKYGYQVLEKTGVSKADHYVMNIHSTRDALKWIYDKNTKEGDVSPLYECGDNDHLLVMVLSKIKDQDFDDLSNPALKDFVRQQVIIDKKAEIIMAKAEKCNSIAAAQKAGAKISDVKQVTYASPVFVQSTNAREVGLSGAVAATAKGKVSKPIKGNSGVYIIKVVNKKQIKKTFDAQEYANKFTQKAMESIQSYSYELEQNANVKDNRYLFF